MKSYSSFSNYFLVFALLFLSYNSSALALYGDNSSAEPCLSFTHFTMPGPLVEKLQDCGQGEFTYGWTGPCTQPTGFIFTACEPNPGYIYNWSVKKIATSYCDEPQSCQFDSGVGATWTYLPNCDCGRFTIFLLVTDGHTKLYWSEQVVVLGPTC